MSDRKEWMLGLPGHNELVKLADVELLVRGGSLRATDLVKKVGEPWKAAGEMPELEALFEEAEAAEQAARAAKAAAPAPPGPPTETRRTAATDKLKVQARPSDSARLTKTEAKAAAPPAAPAKPPEAAPPIRPVTRRAEAPPPKPETSRIPAPSPDAAAKKEPVPPPPPAPPAKPAAGASAATDRIKKPAPAPRPAARIPRRLNPMAGKYYSPVDMLHSASFAFEPKKLLVALGAALPLAVAASLGMAPRGEGAAAVVLPLLALLLTFFGLAFVLTALAYVTRRQLEGAPYLIKDVLHWVTSNVQTALLYPAVLAPSGLAFAALYGLGALRNRSSGMASFLKIAYLFPMLLAVVALLGIFVFQLGSMYIPAAGAIEGEGMSGALRHAWKRVSRQWGKVVLHWLIVTVACGVISIVCLGIANLAVELPEFVFGAPPAEDAAIGQAWSQFAPLFLVYRGLAFGLGLVLPVSLLSTLGTLSYLALRHPASAPVSVAGGMDETSGVMVGADRGASGLQDATQAEETRPSPESTAHGSKPALTPVPGSTPAAPPPPGS